MKLRLLLPLLALSLFTASTLSAQQSPASAQFRIAGGFQLPVLTQDEFKQLLSHAQMGDREAQYWPFCITEMESSSRETLRNFSIG
jgi:hypothetical protein